MVKNQKSRGRNVHGILLLDKPIGITSNGALQHVKRLYGARKAGHTGSLDKMASGLLPICFGEATKFSGYLLDADKHYTATCQLGISTTTGDALGEEISVRPVPELTDKYIKEVLADFCGEISQVPPMYSALKHKGQRLYQLAYQGIEVERKARIVTIHELILLGYADHQIEIEVRCSKGTYIRTLAEDIGKALGCGAHVTALRRLGSGPFNASQMVTSYEIEGLAGKGTTALDEKLLSMDSAVSDLQEIKVAENMAFFMLQGQAVTVPRAPTEGLVRIYVQDRKFLGIGEVLDDGQIAPRRLVKIGARS